MCKERGDALLKNLDDNLKRWLYLVETYGKKSAQEIVELEGQASESAEA